MAILIKSDRILPALTSQWPLICLILLFLCTFINAKDGSNFTDSGASQRGKFPLARFRRQPQGRDALTTSTSIESSINSTRNYESKLGKLDVENENSSTPSQIGNHKSRFKKKGIVLTLNLRNKEPISRLTTNDDNNNNNNGISHHVTITQSPLTQEEIVVTTAISGEPTSALKAIKILDRLSKLTNIKLKSAAIVNSGTNFGLKNRFKPNLEDRRAAAATTAETTTVETDQGTDEGRALNFDKSQTIFGSFSPEDSEIVQKLKIPTTSKNSQLETTPVSSKQAKVGGHISLEVNSKEKSEILEKIEKAKLRGVPGLTRNLNPSSSERIDTLDVSTENSSVNGELHIKQESRFITADQIGGNRPTRTPFHFTTPTVPPYIPTTTTETRTRPQVSRHNHRNPHSPHNHIYAPTQDPIAVAHNEDLNVEDFHDFRAAHLAFGSKVGAQVTTPPSDIGLNDGGRAQALPVRTLRKKAQITIQPPTPPPPTTTTPPYRDSAPSGLKNSHINPRTQGQGQGGQKRTNNINEQLPFYKEPGGIFEHPKYHSNSQIEANEIQFDEKIAGVKYAPKGPSAQPQTNVYSSPRHQNQHQNQNQHQHHHQHQVHHQQLPILPPPQPTQPLPTPPQYVQVTQQPIYLAQVPIQQAQGYGPIPQQNNYYHQPVAQHPVQVPPQYYPPPPQQQQQLAPQIYNHGNQQQGGFVPVIQNYQSHQPQPLPAPPVYAPQQQRPPAPAPPPRNAYYIPPQNRLPGQEDEDAYYHDTDRRPPARHDPDSDDFYGNPIAVPPKPQSSKPKPAKRPSSSSNSGRTTRPEPIYEEPPTPPVYRDRERGGSRSNQGRNRNFDDRYEPAKPPPPLPSAPRRQTARRNYRPSSNSNSPQRREPSPDYDESDYDTDPNENVDEVVRPSQPSPQPQRQRPTYEEPEPHRQFINSEDNFQQPPTPFFKPSDDDYRLNASPDNRPNFEHPNIYFDGRTGTGNRPQASRNRQRGPNVAAAGHRQGDGRRGPDEDHEDDGDHARGTGDFGESTDRSLPLLDPIYTRTIKQFDEDLERQNNQHNRNNNNNDRNNNNNDNHNDNNAHEEDDDHYSPRPRPRPQTEETEEYPRQRQQSQARQRYPQQQEEEQEEEPENEDDKEEKEEETRPAQRERGRGNEREREQPEQEEEEEEEEETKAVPQKKGAQPQEEEEEEEEEEEQEEEKPAQKKQERGRKAKKKKPPKDQKSGNLDDDIIGIEREFGSYSPDVGGGHHHAPNHGGGHNHNHNRQQHQQPHVQYHPVLGR